LASAPLALLILHWQLAKASEGAGLRKDGVCAQIITRGCAAEVRGTRRRTKRLAMLWLCTNLVRTCQKHRPNMAMHGCVTFV